MSYVMTFLAGAAVAGLFLDWYLVGPQQRLLNGMEDELAAKGELPPPTCEACGRPTRVCLTCQRAALGWYVRSAAPVD